MSTRHQVRLFLFHAALVPKTLILRRGPRRLHWLCLWHRDENRFEDGQWIKADVTPENSALSPDARHFIAQVMVGGHRGGGMGLYTVLSRPPYWTALSLIPASPLWDGGGAFHGLAHYEVFTRQPVDDIYANDIGLTRIFATPKGYVLRDHTPITPPPAPPAAILPDIVTDAGRLMRVQEDRLTLIRDFTDMRFAPVVAPYAASICNRSPWHPLNSDSPPCP